jgi:hypothetical protein
MKRKSDSVAGENRNLLITATSRGEPCQMYKPFSLYLLALNIPY